MAAPITELRAAVKAALTTEFAAEIPAASIYNDKMHPAMPGPRAAVYPANETVGEAGIVMSMFVIVQVFGRWDPEIDPAQKVDPALIEGWAWRWQRRCRTASHTNTAHVYWFNVAQIEYPPDPTDNITRFHCLIEGFEPNAQLMETTA